jgi:hypothetical protein
MCGGHDTFFYFNTGHIGAGVFDKQLTRAVLEEALFDREEADFSRPLYDLLAGSI